MNISIKHSTNDSKGVLQFLFKTGMVSISTIHTPSVAIFNYTGDNITQRYDNGLNAIYNPTAQNISDMLLWAEKNLNGPTREEMVKEIEELATQEKVAKDILSKQIDRRLELEALVGVRDREDEQRAFNAGWTIEEHGMYKGTWVSPKDGMHYKFDYVREILNRK